MRTSTQQHNNARRSSIFLALFFALAGVILLAGERFALADNAPTTTQATQQYVDQQYGFAFTYPIGFHVGVLPGDASASTTLLIQDSQDNDGIQVMISPWDEGDDAITPERIEHDIPDFHLSDVDNVALSGENKGGHAIVFLSDNDAYAGGSAEAVFAHDGHIYHLSTYARNRAMLEEILWSWRLP